MSEPKPILTIESESETQDAGAYAVHSIAGIGLFENKVSVYMIHHGDYYTFDFKTEDRAKEVYAKLLSEWRTSL